MLLLPRWIIINRKGGEGMKYKIAICDDDPSQWDYLEGIVAAWAKKGNHLVEVCKYAHARHFLFDYEEKKDFDVLLLDIEMPEISGIELAKTVRKDSAAIQIIFVTGYYEYFSDGFDVSALHYLIKPITEEKLLPVLDRAAENLRFRQKSVLISTADGEIKLSLADITYAEAENVYVIVHTLRGSYRTRMPLAKFSQRLDETFMQVHRSFVVGLKYVRKITRTEITLAGGDTVPIRRGMYDEIHAALIRYL